MKSLKVMILTIAVGILIFTNAHAGGITVSCDANQFNLGESIEAILSIDSDLEALGAFQLSFCFDPELLELEGVDAGENAYFSGRATFKIDNEKGILIINGFQSVSLEEPKGSSSVAKIRLKTKKAIDQGPLFWIHEASIFNTEGKDIPIEFIKID